MQTLFQTTRFEPLAPTTLQPRSLPTDQQPSGFSLAAEELFYFLECYWALCAYKIASLVANGWSVVLAQLVVCSCQCLKVDQNHIFEWRENVSQLVLFVQDLQEDNILRALGHPQLQQQQLLRSSHDCGGLQSCMRNLWLQWVTLEVLIVSVPSHPLTLPMCCFRTDFATKSAV